MNSAYCKIYLAWGGETGHLVELASTLVKVDSVTGKSLSSGPLSLEVYRNPDHRAGSDDFLEFGHLLELDSTAQGEPDAQVIALVSALLEVFWARGMTAVASCDYEDQLPHSGGYRNGVTYRPPRSGTG